ncbi:MAG: tyrosine-type recombinase/integrase [Myxococcota bacterium]
MAWLEMGDFGKVRTHKDGRIYIDLPKAASGERRIWSHPMPGGHMPWTEETATRALELIRSRIAQGATVDEAMAIFLPSAHVYNLVLARAARWLEIKKREADSGDRSPTYVRELERYLRPKGHFSWWAERSIHDVSYAALEDWSHWLADRGLSPKTRWNILAGFRSFLGWLYKREEIRELPREYPWPKPPEATPAPLSPRTQDQILDAIPENRRGIYLAMGLMGVRPGEAVALDVSDYHDGWFTVARARKGKRLDAPIRSTKTGKVKRLPVPPVLREWVEQYVSPEGRLRGEPLFIVPWSGRGIRPRGRWSGTSLRRTWMEACARVGVKVSLYVGTKHTFATDAAARGVSERALQTFLGHADIRSTRRYVRMADGALLDVLRPSRGADGARGARAPKKPLKNQRLAGGPGRKVFEPRGPSHSRWPWSRRLSHRSTSGSPRKLSISDSLGSAIG